MLEWYWRGKKSGGPGLARQSKASKLPVLLSGHSVGKELFDHVLQLLVARGRGLRLGGLVALLQLLQLVVGLQAAQVEALHLPLLPLVVLPDVLLVQTANVCTHTHTDTRQLDLLHTHTRQLDLLHTHTPGS